MNDEQFAFPVDKEKLDGRLPAGEMVLTVETGGAMTAFRVTAIGEGGINAEVGGEVVVVFTEAGGLSVAAFSRTLDGQALSFDLQGDGRFTDRETGSTWDFAGRAEVGPLAGSRLDRVSNRRSFWFAVAISLPCVKIHTP